MPELPEVETTARALRPVLRGRKVSTVVIRNRRLRWPVPADLEDSLSGARVLDVTRRAKYLLIRTNRGTLIVHLGMSGSFCIVPREKPPGKHDHIDIVTDRGRIIRYHDPRKFGSFHWTTADPDTHRLLAGLGPEPWDDTVNGEYLYSLSRRRPGPIKAFLMDGRVMVGIGNIYANEALFLAGIRPARPAKKVTRDGYEVLVACVRQVLEDAIRAGGTTLRDFAAGRGQAGDFQVSLNVYGRAGKPCPICGSRLLRKRISGRPTVWCPRCQH